MTSALWGLLRPADRVPTYRLSMGVDLPGLGPLAAFWRNEIRPILDDEGQRHLLVDCRSSTYAAAWRPRGSVAGRTVAVRVLTEREGWPVVVSHMAKHTCGLVTRHLLDRSGRDPRTPEPLIAAVAERSASELVPPDRPGGTWTLDVLSSG